MKEIKEFAFYLKDGMYVWRPTPGITGYELALVLPAFTAFNHVPVYEERCAAFQSWIKTLPPLASRHLEYIKYEQ